MECGYYDSFVFGWYCVGILTGAFACSHLSCSKPRTVVKYVTMYRPIAEAESDNESVNDTSIPMCTNEFQVGDKVRVVLPDGQTEPSFGWGGVSPDDIGYISSNTSEYVKDTLCYRVDFPTQKYWLALVSELQHVSV